MEDLLKQQRTEIDDLNRMISNYKKDSVARKTTKYLLDKKLTFGELIRVIKENDNEIQGLREPKFESQAYFTDDTFKKINELYKISLKDIEERLQEIQLNTQPNGNLGKQTTPTDKSKHRPARSYTTVKYRR